MSNLEPLFFRTLAFNELAGLRPDRSRTALHQQVRLLGEVVHILKNRVERGDCLEYPIADGLASLLIQIATFYGKMQLAVPVRWETDHTHVTHEAHRRPGAINASLTLIDRHQSAIELLSRLRFAEVYVAIAALLHQMTCCVLELAVTLNINAVGEFDKLITALEDSRKKLPTA